VKAESATRVLVIGYGNPGRQDDGLGPHFAERVQALALPNVTAESDYQLTVEDALTIANHEVVIFADADIEGPAPFTLSRLEAQADGSSLSSHTLSAGSLLGLTRTLYGAAPQAYLLAIRGYAFDMFEERLTPQAQANLEAALEAVEPLLRAGFAKTGTAALQPAP